MTNAVADAVVVDANVVLAICSRENLTYNKALTAVEEYARDGWEFHAPNVLTAEVLFVLCRKLADGILSETDHAESVAVCPTFELYQESGKRRPNPDLVRGKDPRFVRLQPNVRQPLFGLRE